jgi:hypothetical protein
MKYAFDAISFKVIGTTKSTRVFDTISGRLLSYNGLDKIKAQPNVSAWAIIPEK